jgi:signal transduction histidine kinase
VDVLLENALVHGRGAVTLRLRRDAGVIRLSVADRGAGIGDDDGDRIFERGVSLASGSGLGLAVARELAHAGDAELRLARRSPPRFELSMPAGR